MSIERSYNFRRVSKTVTTSGLLAAEHVAGLRESGYEVLINLLPDSSEHALHDEEGIARSHELEYVYIPVDFGGPDPRQLDEFALVMDANAERATHVHCAANYRASVFYALYAVRKGWWSTERADEHIHSIWIPDDDPVWRDFIALERARASR